MTSVMAAIAVQRCHMRRKGSLKSQLRRHDRLVIQSDDCKRGKIWLKLNYSLSTPYNNQEGFLLGSQTARNRGGVLLLPKYQQKYFLKEVANAKIILIFKPVYCPKNLFIKQAKLASWTSSAGKVLLSQVVTHAVFNRSRVKEFIELSWNYLSNRNTEYT